MAWLIEVFSTQSVAQALLMLSLAIAVGLALGQLSLRGIRLGVGGVLFAGLALGHLSGTPDQALVGFVRELGLVLFVYAIGLQVGPGFFSSLRRRGLQLNLLALGVVLGGTALAIVALHVAGLRPAAAIGVLSGAVTNTPSLGAAQEALKDVPARGASQLVGLGYAVAYPFGILGVILAMLLLRRLFRVDPEAEARELEQQQAREVKPIIGRTIVVANPNLRGATVHALEDLVGPGVVVSRVLRAGQQLLAAKDLPLALDDQLIAVGTAPSLERFTTIVGHRLDAEAPPFSAQLTMRRAVITRREVVGRTVAQLELEDRHGVIVTRVVRAGVEFSPTPDLHLQFGDRLLLVGLEQATRGAAADLGDSVKALEKPDLIPIFVGLALGVLVGSLPLALPGVPAPVKLGLAGGPLLIAILMGRLGKVGPLLSYMPNAAKELLKELGIALFLAAVGLLAGARLADLLAGPESLLWLAAGAAITFLPVLTVGIVARLALRLDFTALLGLLAGSMTDPPALAFACELARSEAPAVTYATVYPLTMLARVLIAQLLVLLLLG